MRGDADADGLTFSLLDAVHILRWAFVDGAVPPCMDGADVDDNGSVQGLLDSFFLLNFAFNDGDDPPDPGPTECGPDPTDDDEGCLEPADFCV